MTYQLVCAYIVNIYIFIYRFIYELIGSHNIQDCMFCSVLQFSLTSNGFTLSTETDKQLIIMDVIYSVFPHICAESALTLITTLTDLELQFDSISAS